MQKAIAVTEVPGYQGYSLPQSELRRREHIGRNLLDRLVKSGEVDSYVLGARIRHVVMASWYAYIARCQAGGLPRDPVEKARAAETYKLSVARSIGAKATKTRALRLATGSWEAWRLEALEPQASAFHTESVSTGCSSAEDEPG